MIAFARHVIRGRQATSAAGTSCARNPALTTVELKFTSSPA